MNLSIALAAAVAAFSLVSQASCFEPDGAKDGADEAVRVIVVPRDDLECACKAAVFAAIHTPADPASTPGCTPDTVPYFYCALLSREDGPCGVAEDACVGLPDSACTATVEATLVFPPNACTGSVGVTGPGIGLDDLPCQRATAATQTKCVWKLKAKCKQGGKGAEHKGDAPFPIHMGGGRNGQPTAGTGPAEFLPTLYCKSCGGSR